MQLISALKKKTRINKTIVNFLIKRKHNRYVLVNALNETSDIHQQGGYSLTPSTHATIAPGDEEDTKTIILKNAS